MVVGLPIYIGLQLSLFLVSRKEILETVPLYPITCPTSPLDDPVPNF